MLTLRLEKETVMRLLAFVTFVVMFTLVPNIEAIAQEEKEANKGMHAVEEPLMDCSDVATQRGAQALFELSMEDRFDLDKDEDGVACETPNGRAVAEDGTKVGAEVGADLDCMDFPSQKAAQGRLRSAPTDPHDLDIDNNGIACEIRPADYDDPAQDLEPVAGARSTADLDCEDFEYQHEAQMVYFQDKSDPNNLDEGVVDLTPVGGHTRVSDVNVDEGRPQDAGSNTKLPARV